MKILKPTLILSLSFATILPSIADDWPFYRGPKRNGISEEAGWKTNWGKGGPKVAWEKQVGIGSASFAVVGDRVLTSGNLDNQDAVFCFDAASGKEIWARRLEVKFEKRMWEGGTAATPTIHKDKVYHFSYDGQLHCLSLKDGSVIWKVHVIEDFGGALSRWKYAGSPLIVGNRLFLDIGGKPNSTLALDANTGKKIWGSGEDNAGYTSVIPFHHGKTPAGLVYKSNAMLGVSLIDGSLLWRIPWVAKYDVTASSPSVAGDKLLISSGYKPGRTCLYQLTGGEPRKLWQNDDLKTKMNSAVIYKNHVYGISERKAMVMCLDLATGKTVWEEKGAGQFGNLVVVDGKLVMLSDSGELLIAPASPRGFSVEAKAQILDKRCWVMPVLANGRLYAKNNIGHVVCLDLR
jgi:outer membrane protein assembly factor BamB